MEKRSSFFLTLSAGAMALIWRLAVANTISLAAFSRPYPLAEAVLALALAAMIGAATRRRGLRVITVMGIHGIGLTLAILRTVYVYLAGSHSFVSLCWIPQWLSAGPGFNAWLCVLLQAFLAVGFWWGGLDLIRGRESLRSHYNRFDIGLAAFFVLFLTRFLIWHKSGIELQDSLSEKLLVSFMIFSLLAIAMARHQGTVRTQFISGKKIIGMTLSISVAVVLFSAGLMLFFLPYMTAAAEVGYTALKTVSGPVIAVLIAILRFMYGPRRVDQQLSPPARKPPPVMSDEVATNGSWWIDLIEKIFGYAALGVVTVLLLAAVIALIWILARWLWRKTPDEGKSRTGNDIAAFRYWLETMALRLVSLCRTASSLFHSRPRTRAFFFRALLKWGRRSGMPIRISETPLEYGRRLQAGFPLVESEIAYMVDLFNREKYGGQDPDLHNLDQADASWQKLRSPLLWGRRLRTWIFQPVDRG